MLVKKSQRSVRKPCRKCGAVGGLYWYQDTSSGRYVLCDAKGERHECTPEAVAARAAMRQGENPYRAATPEDAYAERIAGLREPVAVGKCLVYGPKGEQCIGTGTHDAHSDGKVTWRENVLKSAAGSSAEDALDPLRKLLAPQVDMDAIKREIDAYVEAKTFPVVVAIKREDGAEPAGG